MKKYIVLGFALLALSARLPAQSSVNAKLSAAASNCNTTNVCLTLSTPNFGGVTFTVSANASSNTLQFEASADFGVPGVTTPSWVSLNATPSNSSTAASSTTSTGTWQANISAYRAVRIRMSSLVSGTSTVTITTSPVSARSGGGGGGSGTVTSVTGTANQIDVATGTTTPVLSIDSTFLFPGTFGYSSLATGTFNGIGTTATDSNLLTNTTVAAAGAQQFSPAIHWTGQGWKTAATAASQTVEFRAYVIPVQGTTNPTANWQLESQINGAGFGNPLKYFSTGQIQVVAGSQSVPSITFSSLSNGLYERATGIIDQATSGTNTPNEFFAGGIRQGSNGVFAFTNTSNNAALSSDTGLSRVSAGIVGVGTGASGNVAGTLQSGAYQTGTFCKANGTAANPSVASCGSSAAGMFSCATNASGATCQVNTTAVTANSSISITQNAADGGASQLNVTCNTASDLPSTAPILASKSSGTSFTINVGTISTNPACFEYIIVN